MMKRKRCKLLIREILRTIWSQYDRNMNLTEYMQHWPSVATRRTRVKLDASAPKGYFLKRYEEMLESFLKKR